VIGPAPAQGKFTGWLESSRNPAWDGVTRAVCTLPVAAISAAPPALGNSTLAAFSFSASDRAAPRVIAPRGAHVLPHVGHSARLLCLAD